MRGVNSRAESQVVSVLKMKKVALFEKTINLGWCCENEPTSDAKNSFLVEGS